nr:PROBABLE CONSERVED TRANSMEMBRANE PROTEIN RICH IN ALANINE AND ARGININE AND PROLINE [Kibdelosporangium sp. MJ126-NF4]CTQ94450.1 PROBABLE CONSERVED TRANSMEMBRANE PROTEIN RICH IN ALANINE AND ARGININE AND PROLINE [Kibdelosporangium sp. MJ126-NF4]
MPSTARLLLGGALVLVLGATLILVLTDDARFLKMGILAALWAALVGAFLAARFRRQVADKTDDAQSMQAIYELELEREIAARREYELELEADAKQKAEEQSRADIDALRTELSQLRETLQTLLGGEVLVERFALQAQATRMRSLPDEAHQLPSQGQVVKRLNPAASASSASQQQPVIISSEPQTELIERVSERPRGGNARPQPQRPQQQRPPREPAERQLQIRQSRRDDPADPGSGWWDPVTPVGNQENPYHRPVAGDSATSLGEGIDPNWTPSWERGGGPQPQQTGAHQQAAAAQQHAAAHQQAQAAAQQTGAQQMAAAQQQAQAAQQAAAHQAAAHQAAAQPRQQAGRPPRPPKKPEPQPSRPMQRPEPEAPTRVQPQPELGHSLSQRLEPESQVSRPMQRPEPDSPTRVQPLPEAPEPTVVRQPAARATEPLPPPPPVRKPVDESAGRRRAAEPEANGGGRRRRADDAPSWQETYQARQQSGTHTQPEPEPSGSHANGKSVNELLAAYGGTGDTPRRRRRRED